MVRHQLKSLLLNPISVPLSQFPWPGSVWLAVPSLPGIYIFADENKNPLYIGKSINLKSRLKQHYELSELSSSKAFHYVQDAKQLILQPTDSDLSAIILESNLISLYKPPYNSLSKDDKSRCFIIITDPPSPKIAIMRETDLDGSMFNSSFGPYLNGSSAQEVLKKARQIFGYCSNPFNFHSRSCFYYHLKLCPGACNGQVTPIQYQRHLTKIKIFLGGRFSLLLKELNTEISKLSKNQKYETANVLKKQYEHLESAIYSKRYKHLLTLPSPTLDILQNQLSKINHPLLKVSPKRIECFDMATLNQQNTVGVMVVLVDGIPDKKEYRKFIVGHIRPGDPAAMASILERRFHHREWSKPDLIILDGGIPQLNIAGRQIPDSIPVIALSKQRETLHFYDQEHHLVNINLPLHSPLLNIFRFARDEAHRYGTTFQKQRREKKALEN